MELRITPEAVKAELALPSRKKKFFFYSLKAMAITLLLFCVTFYSTKYFPHSYPISYATANWVNWLVYWIVLLLAAPFAAYLTIAIHEIGHVLAGAAVGERLMLIKLGGFRIAREKQGFRVRRYGWLLPIGGGTTVTAPTTAGPSRWRASVLMMGGPLCTLFQFAALWALSTHWPFQPPTLWLVAMLDALYFMTLLGLFTTVLPLKIIGFATDIDRVFHLLRGGAQTERALRISWLFGQTLLGVRPSAYKQAELDQVLNPSDGSEQEQNALLLAYNRAVDQGDQKLTVAFLERLLAISMMQTGRFWQPTPLVLAACTEAKTGRGPATARAWLALLTEPHVATFAGMPMLVELHQIRMLAWAEIYLAEHKWAEAKLAAQQSLQWLEQSINAGAMVLNQQRLAEILEQTHDASTIMHLPVEPNRVIEATPVDEAPIEFESFDESTTGTLSASAVDSHVTSSVLEKQTAPNGLRITPAAIGLREKPWLRIKQLLKGFLLYTLVAVIACPIIFYTWNEVVLFHVRVPNESWAFFVSRLLLLPLGFYLTFVIHETGHLIAGALTRCRFLAVIIGPLRIIRTVHGLKVQSITFFPLFGGVLSVPNSLRYARWQRLVVVMGGPLATFLQLWILYQVRLAHPSDSLAFGLGSVLDIVIIFTLLTLFSCLAPAPLMNKVPDGLQILQLLWGSQRLKRQLYLQWANEQSPKLVSSELDKLTFPADGSPEEFTANLIGYQQTMANANPQRSVLFLTRALELLARTQAEFYLETVAVLEAAYIEATYGAGPAAARLWLAALPYSQQQALKSDPFAQEAQQLRFRVLAAIALAEGNAAEAQEAAQQSLALLENTIDLGLYQSEKRRLETILHQTAGYEPQAKAPVSSQARLTRFVPSLKWVSTAVATLVVSYLLGGLILFANDLNVKLLGLGHMLIAEGAVKMQAFPAAIHEFDQALSFLPDMYLIRWHRARSYAALGKHNEALLDLNEIIKHQPNVDLNVYLNRAESYTQLQQYKAAIADYEHILARTKEKSWLEYVIPKLSRAYWRLGFQQWQQEQYELAIASYTQALNYAPSSGDLYQARGAIYADLHQWDNALADYNRALEQEQDVDPEIYVDRGDIYVKQKQLRKAIEDYTKAIALDADFDGSIYWARGRVYAEQNEWEKALNDYNIAIQRAPENTEIYADRGHIYLQQ